MKLAKSICHKNQHLLSSLLNKHLKMPVQNGTWKFYTKHFHRFNSNLTPRQIDDCHQKYLRRIHCSSSIYSGENSSYASQAAAGIRVDTIFSLSSGHGKCGVAVVRISGPAVGHILATVGQFTTLPVPRKAYLRTLVHPEQHYAIDKGLVLYFPKPSSFTGEECVEFQVHGGPAVVSALLSALHAVPGCRQADPGEFTKRAFLNGKLDLTKVEGLGDLIHAETEAQRRQALRQMDGDLSRLYGRWRQAIIKCVADLEAFIDFGEEQHIEDSVVQQVDRGVKAMRRQITQHINDNRQGERLREGVHVAIIGEPNVGKSSLLNVICQRPAAIVTEIAGTTRDVIDTPINIGGYPVLLSDTAGLRETEDVVEKEGVTRALKRAQQADIVVLVLDLGKIDLKLLKDFHTRGFVEQQLKSLGITSVDSSSQNLTKQLEVTKPDDAEDLDTSWPDSQCENYDTDIDDIDNNSETLNTIIVLNKSDLLTQRNLDTVSEQFMRNGLDYGLNNHNGDASEIKVETNTYKARDTVEGRKRMPVPVCTVSCIHGDGMEDFLKILKDRVADMCGNPLSSHPSLTQARHRTHLVHCLDHLDEYDRMTSVGDSVLAAQALRCALWEIGKITGKITSEDILDVIFKDFCIGK